MHNSFLLALNDIDNDSAIAIITQNALETVIFPFKSNKRENSLWPTMWEPFYIFVYSFSYHFLGNNFPFDNDRREVN